MSDEVPKIRVDIKWTPENKKTVKEYAQARGLGFNQLVEMVLVEHIRQHEDLRNTRRR